MAERIVFNVSGKKYETDSGSLAQSGSHKLQQLARMVTENGEIYINRPSNSFEAILAYHQTNELHIPENTCPGAFKTELEYYEIDYKKLETCCFNRYNSFLNDQLTLKKFHKYSEPKDSDNDQDQVSRWQCFRRKIWRTLNYHNSSVMAKVYFIVFASLILLSILSLAMGTHEAFRRQVNMIEKKEIVDYERDHNDEDCEDKFTDWVDEEDFDIGELNDTCTDLYNKIKNTTVPIDIIWYIDVCLLGIFVVDFLMRIAFCPSLKGYFKSVVNTLDTIALIGSLSGIVMNNVWSIERFETDAYDIIPNLQVLRAVRVLRIVQNLDNSKVLSFVLATSIADLGVLLSFLFISVLIFSNFIYYLEDRKSMPDIPTAYWWSIITMTTVGFGDITPKTVSGRCLGAICAISGVVLIAITTPIFVNSFVLVYNYSKLQKNTYPKGNKVKSVEKNKF